jgi:transcriptional regulator with XRE-family HTH domain
LREWGKLPPWEIEPAGYLLRLSREKAQLTQAELARRLDSSQQAVAQAERWESNPTVDFMRRWAEACRSKLTLEFGPSRGRS